ncbi:hypothetical protein EGW08_021464 [Elysia chlorotica]|uniref:Neurotransmitter-gated ion-channel ligand-binding domain-containing protein n=1 Tax=Elysia chlorotica TaxID=188477 RepID=A0A433SNK8_ELYCH|nr:hypothetical protein EGW08_021464 [Elysia chlorotica]
MTFKAFRQFPLLLLVYAAFLISENFANGTIGYQLIQNVFDGYQPDVRPICEHSKSLDLNLGIAIRQLIEVNNAEQKLITNVWFRMLWTDCRIHWNPEDYAGHLRIIVPTSRVWVPDLTLYENAESKLWEVDEYMVAVNHNGNIAFNLPVVVKSMCKLNVAMFPFDYQTCFLTLGSWVYGDHEVNVTVRNEHPADLRSYISHGEWDLWKLEATEFTLRGYDNVGYAQVIFTVHLQRKSLFHTINLILPSLIVKSIAIIGFLLPPECGEKLNLEITVLLSLLVFQLVILNNMPHSSENIPVIALYFLVSMIMIALSCLCTVVVLNVHFKKHVVPLPDWIRQIITGRAGRLFRLEARMTETHNKLQMLRNENLLKRNKQNCPPESNPNGRSNNCQRKTSASSVKGLGHFALSLRPRKSKEPKDDSMYGFYPNSAYSYSPTDTSCHGRFSDQTIPDPVTATTSFFSINVHELRQNASEPHAEDTVTVSVSRQIFAHFQQKATSGLKKQITELLELEWRIFAVFLDRLFLFTFLITGFINVITVLTYITS